MQNRCSLERYQAVSRGARLNLSLENEDESRERWECVERKARERNLMTFNGVVYLALCIVTGELAEFCRRHTAGGIVLVQREFVRSAPYEYRECKQQEQPATRSPRSSSLVARYGPLIVIL